MGKIDSVTITYGDRKNPVYRPGDTIFGKVTLVVSGEVSINGVKLHCFGAALAKWTTSAPRQSESESRSTEMYFNKECCFIDGKSQPKLTDGRYSFDYRFEIPNDNLPSSYEGEFGAVRYWLRFRVGRNFPGVDCIKLSPFTLLANLDVNDYMNPVTRNDGKTISKAIGLGKAGTLDLSATLSRGAYCPGENMLISFIAINNSTKDLGSIKVKLIQRSWFIVSREEEIQTQTVKGFTMPEKLEKNGRVELVKHPLQVPEIPPSTKERSCLIIDVSYYLEVEIGVPRGFDLSVKLPVKIGTVPLGAKTVKSINQHTDCKDYNRVGLTKTITYKACSKGVKVCTKKDSDLPFPSMTYIPSTTYVVTSRDPSTAITTPGQSSPVTVTTDESSTPTTPTTPQNTAPPIPTKTILSVNLPPAAPTAPPPEHLPVFQPDRSLYPNLGSSYPHVIIPMHLPNELPPPYTPSPSPTSPSEQVYTFEPESVPATALVAAHSSPLASELAATTSTALMSESSTTEIEITRRAPEQTLRRVQSVNVQKGTQNNGKNPTSIGPRRMNSMGSRINITTSQTTGNSTRSSQNSGDTARSSQNTGETPTSYTTPTSGNIVATSPPPTSVWAGATIGAIFPSNCLQQVKLILNRDVAAISANEGRVLAVFDEFQIEPPAETAAVFLVFSSESKAAEWAQLFLNSNPIQDLHIVLSVNDSPTSTDVKDLSLYPFVALSLNYKDLTKTISEDLAQTSSNLSKKIFTPLRMEFGGKSLLIATKVKLLFGDWAGRPYAPDQVSVSISLWPTKALYDAYIRALNSNGEYRVFHEIYKLTHVSLIQAQTVNSVP